MSELLWLEWLARIELSPVSTAIREVWWVFPSVLVMHSLSMAMMAGFGVVICTRAMGFVTSLPMVTLNRFMPLFWAGLAAAALSGLILLTAYPAKALTNPLFYIKLLMLSATAWICLQLIKSRLLPPSQNRLAVLGLCGWVSVIFAGRFLAYTHSVLMASWLVSPTGG
ncbi:MAG: hypothetical protein Q7W55_16585 [Pseudohongiella sp.]|nr:hypothetical protein [Pseudohongiella sp.]MDO9520222.1 hypothetical protein [Pseudohongiella sp.]